MIADDYHEQSPPLHIGEEEEEDASDGDDDVNEDFANVLDALRPSRNASNDSDGPVLNTDANFSTLAAGIAGSSQHEDAGDERVVVVDPNASPGEEVASTSVKGRTELP